MLPTLSSGHVSCPDIVLMGVTAGSIVVEGYLPVIHLYFCFVSDGGVLKIM